VVLIAHGFKGFKDWGFFPYLAERLAAAGLVSVCLNFSMNGIGLDPQQFTRLDLFERNSLEQERDDLLDLMDCLDRGELKAAGPVDSQRLGLLGHSRGGGIVILLTAEDPRPTAVATWAAVASPRFDSQQFDAWRQAGYFEVLNSRTGQRMRLGLRLLDELTTRAEQFDVAAAAARLRVPLLVVHAADDAAVPVQDAYTIRDAACAAPTRLVLTPDGGHTFGAAHPFSSPHQSLLKAVEETVRWFRVHLQVTDR
jgi:dipeptidyl aminopeptidase/acylaminoacyl peptidase